MLQQQGVAAAADQRHARDAVERDREPLGRGQRPLLHLSLNANPVELSALITAFPEHSLYFYSMINTEKLRNALPSADKLDGLMYKLAESPSPACITA